MRKTRRRAIVLAFAAVSLAATAADTGMAGNGEPGPGAAVSGHIEHPFGTAPRPVTILNREDIRLSGMKNLADILRRSVHNSFGSDRERSGFGTAQTAFLGLNGLGSGNTLILVDGRRIPGSPFAGGSQADLNTLPLSAVERIEFLTGGAAAIHGPDAAGGAVNIVLRKSIQDAEVQGTIERPTRAGAESEHASVLWGGDLDGGRLTFGAEYFRRAAIGDRDRGWSRSTWTPGGAFADARNVSLAGNTVFVADYSDARSLGDCDPEVYTGVLSEPLGIPGATGCGFPYADISFMTGSLERTGFLLNAEHEIDALGDGTTLYFDARYTDGRTAGRFAPPVAPGLAVACNALPGSVTSSFCSGADTVIVAHRFVAHGNRDESTELNESDLVLGVRGALGGGMGYDAYLRHYRYDAAQSRGSYVSEARILDAISAGDYDLVRPFQTERDVIARTGLQLTRSLLTDYREVHASLDGSAPVSGGVGLRWDGGVEHAVEDYRDIYDYRNAFGATSGPEDALGSSGASARGERRRWTGFGEMGVSWRDDLEVSVAARLDDFDDMGSMLSRQAAASWRPFEHFALRASWERGFKAPGLNLFHSEEVAGYPACPSGETCAGGAQVEVVTAGNPALRPSETESVNLGATTGWRGLSLSADYFRTEIRNTVTILGLDEILRLERDGALPRGAGVERAGDVITRIRNPAINRADAKVEVRGIGMGARIDWDAGPADMALNARWSRILRYEEPSGDARLGGSIGGRAFPRDRLNMSLDAARGRVAARWSVHAISGFENPGRTGRLESWIGHDLLLSWRDPFGFSGAELMAGVRNLTDRDPPIDPVGGYAFAADPVLSLYPVEGRTLYMTFSHRW